MIRPQKMLSVTFSKQYHKRRNVYGECQQIATQPPRGEELFILKSTKCSSSQEIRGCFAFAEGQYLENY